VTWQAPKRIRPCRITAPVPRGSDTEDGSDLSSVHEHGSPGACRPRLEGIPPFLTRLETSYARRARVDTAINESNLTILS
jgi:hypothetical protein